MVVCLIFRFLEHFRCEGGGDGGGFDIGGSGTGWVKGGFREKALAFL